MFIGVYDSEANRDYSAVANSIEQVIKNIQVEVVNYGDEEFNEDRITVYKGETIKFIKQYIIV